MRAWPERASSLRHEGLKRETSPEYLFITSPLVWLKHSAQLLKNIASITALDPLAQSHFIGLSQLHYIQMSRDFNLLFTPCDAARCRYIHLVTHLHTHSSVINEQVQTLIVRRVHFYQSMTFLFFPLPQKCHSRSFSSLILAVNILSFLPAASGVSPARVTGCTCHCFVMVMTALIKQCEAN